MRLLIIRHGDPNYTKDGLTEKGVVEAKLLAERLAKEKIDYFYVSTYGRARQTAAPTLEKFGAEEVLCDWLHEFDYPITWADGTQRHIPWDMFPSVWTADEDNYDANKWGHTAVMQSGNLLEKYNHVTEEFDKLLASHGYVRDGKLYHAEKANTDTIAFFCHFGLECVLLAHLLHISPVLLWHNTVASPTAVTSVITEEREQGIASFRMNIFGDVSHLTYNGEEPSFQARFCEVYDDFSQRH